MMNRLLLRRGINFRLALPEHRVKEVERERGGSSLAVIGFGCDKNVRAFLCLAGEDAPLPLHQQQTQQTK